MLLGPCVDGAPATGGPWERSPARRGQVVPASHGAVGSGKACRSRAWGPQHTPAQASLGANVAGAAPSQQPQGHPGPAPCRGEGPPKSSGFPRQLGAFQIQTCLWLLVTQEAEWPGPRAPVSFRGGSHLSSFLRCAAQSVSIALPHSFLLFSFWGSGWCNHPPPPPVPEGPVEPDSRGSGHCPAGVGVG